MNKRDLVDEISARCGTSKASTAMIVDELIGAIGRALSEGEKVELRRFGTFALRRRGARTIKNPRSGREVRVPAKIVPFFKSSRHLVTVLEPPEGE